MDRRALAPIALALSLVLAGCKTADSSEWRGGATTPFGQARDSCFDQANAGAEQGQQTRFFVGCMGALGWEPKGNDVEVEGLDD